MLSGIKRIVEASALHYVGSLINLYWRNAGAGAAWLDRFTHISNEIMISSDLLKYFLQMVHNNTHY